jgi:hypothetical protein
MQTDTQLVHYPGHLGPLAVSEIDRGLRKITWDQPVKRVPTAAAESLVRDGGFALAVPIEEAAALYGLDLAQVETAIADGSVTSSVYAPRAADPVPVVVLDTATRRALRKLRPPTPADDGGGGAPTTTAEVATFAATSPKPKRRKA